MKITKILFFILSILANIIVPGYAAKDSGVAFFQSFLFFLLIFLYFIFDSYIFFILSLLNFVWAVKTSYNYLITKYENELKEAEGKMTDKINKSSD